MMKTVKILLLTVFCSSVYVVHADSKIAYVKLNYIVDSLPETKQAYTDLQAFQVKLSNQLQSKIGVCQEEATALEKGRASMTAEAIQKKEANIARLYTDFQNFQQECHNLAANKIAELMSPIREKIQQKIKEVAKEKGYEFVLNSNASNDEDLGLIVVYGNPELDITNIVLKKLGIDPNATKKATTATTAKDGKPKPADNNKDKK